MNYVKEISKKIQNMSGEYSYQMIFADWVAMMALSTSNACQLFHDEVWKYRESRYLDIFNKHKAERVSAFCEMFGMLTDAFSERPSDYLGQIFMESGSGSQKTGQFFTPYHLSELTAGLGINLEDIPDGQIMINEPSCGGGGMIIAAACRLADLGVDYQKRMKVVAQDLDQTAVNMCYVQLSLMGIDAIVCQGDTLGKIHPGNYDDYHKYYTPRNRGCLI